MNLRRLTVLLNDFVEDNINGIIIAAIILVNIIGFFATSNNTYRAFLFYPNRQKNMLIAEKRDIIRKFSEKDRIKNTVEELLLGPINPDVQNIIPNSAKLLNVIVSGNTVKLNFNRETVMDIDTSREKKPSLYYELVLDSIVDSICIQFRNIKKVYFYFDGKEYEYLNTFGPLGNGLRPDYSILKK